MNGGSAVCDPRAIRDETSPLRRPRCGAPTRAGAVGHRRVRSRSRAPQRLARRHAAHGHDILARSHSAGEARGGVAVVGQQHEPFGVEVEPPYRHHVPPSLARARRPSIDLRVAQRRQHARRRAAPVAQRLGDDVDAIEADAIAFGVGRVAELGHTPVHAHATLAQPEFGVPAGGESCGRENFLQPLGARFVGVSASCGQDRRRSRRRASTPPPRRAACRRHRVRRQRKVRRRPPIRPLRRRRTLRLRLRSSAPASSSVGSLHAGFSRRSSRLDARRQPVRADHAASADPRAKPCRTVTGSVSSWLASVGRGSAMPGDANQSRSVAAREHRRRRHARARSRRA